MSQLADLLGSLVHKEAKGYLPQFFTALQSVGKGSKGVFEVASKKPNALPQLFHTKTTSQFADALKRNPNALVKVNGSHYRLSDMHNALKAGEKADKNIFSKLTAVGDDAVAAAGSELRPAPKVPAPKGKAPEVKPDLVPAVTKPGKLSDQEVAEIAKARQLTNNEMKHVNPLNTTIEGQPLKGKKQLVGPTNNTSKVKEQTPVDQKKLESTDSVGVKEGEPLPAGYDALDGTVPNRPAVNWTDKFMSQWEKDPVRTAALTGGGLYAGNKIVNSLFD